LPFVDIHAKQVVQNACKLDATRRIIQ
jgi:hypothetical protein